MLALLLPANLCMSAHMVADLLSVEWSVLISGRFAFVQYSRLSQVAAALFIGKRFTVTRICAGVWPAIIFMWFSRGMAVRNHGEGIKTLSQCMSNQYLCTAVICNNDLHICTQSVGC